MPRTITLVVRAARTEAIALMALMLVQALIPAASAWVAKHIVDGVVQAVSIQMEASVGFHLVLPWLAAELGLITLGSMLGQAASLLNHVIDNRVRCHVQTLVIGKATTLDLSYFEDSKFYDMMRNAANQADWRAPALVRSVLSSAQSAITLASFAGLIFAFNPWLTLVLLVAVVPSFIVEKRTSDLEYNLETGRARERRQMTYYELLLTDNAAVKEVIHFGLGRPLLERYLGFFQKWFREDTVLARKRSAFSILFGLLGDLAYYVAYAWVVYGAAARQITIGDMTMYLALFARTQGSFSSLLSSWNAIREGGLFLNNLFQFLEVQPKTPTPSNPKPVPARIVHGIDFENVSYKYPNRDEFALRNISLHIGSGEKIALVGANGAGKSTFIKLLTRLYEPTEGRILIDGVDMR
ncbi:MAG: ABC transporter ATP-binding protein, partial [Vicinamibacteria bacterium]